MADNSSDAIDAVIVEEEIVFSLSGLCQAAGASPAQVLSLVDEGVLQPEGDAPQRWAFTGPSLRATRTALRLNADLALGTAGAALVLDLLEEISALRARLRRAGLE
ncbi:chaperone modulator CbpM [Pelomonas cellulosilytica]|uniref:Chaperone modulator CbpM n=1 Tax=Pelomonas cellulosilytica TaxID=2906762 RepID=A0ABS8XYH4_9BURK|nr:chaperone modulator CbpM [Pelomonas sp. P8]MCE4554400.1 chaperone modulator CbpM [Pelomonas sp. P8]